MIKFIPMILESAAISSFGKQLQDKLNRKYQLSGSRVPKDDKMFWIDLYENNYLNSIYISLIYVPKIYRKLGIGTMIMDNIINFADKNNKILTLTPSTDFGGTSVSRLESFYKDFGFVKNTGKNKNFQIKDTMYRLPQK